jgi:hypothetical protein
MASFMLIAGAAFAGVASSGSFGRRREGDLATGRARSRSGEDPRSEEDSDGFTLVDIVRGRVAGDFGTGVGREEGLTGADG